MHLRMCSLVFIQASATYLLQGGKGMEFGSGLSQAVILEFLEVCGGKDCMLCFDFIFEIYEHLWDLVPFYKSE